MPSSSARSRISTRWAAHRDSITVARPDADRQGISDHANASIAVLESASKLCGSNVQFAVNPKDGRSSCRDEPARVAVVGLPPRHRSDRQGAAAAGRLHADEIVNDITGATPASFEPTIDYVVTRSRASPSRSSRRRGRLSTAMKSSASHGDRRNIHESLQKALRAGTGLSGFNMSIASPVRRATRSSGSPSHPTGCWSQPSAARGFTVAEVHAIAKYIRVLSASPRSSRRKKRFAPMPAAGRCWHASPQGMASATSAWLTSRSNLPICAGMSRSIGAARADPRGSSRR